MRETRAGIRGRRAVRVPAAFLLLSVLTAIVTTAAAQAGRTSAAAAGTWRVEPTPNPATAEISVLSSVACSSGRICTAVGSSAETLSSPTLPLAERWNGQRWRIQAIPAPGGTSDSLYGVACPSRLRCLAVGNAFHDASRRTTTLIEGWNGKRWKLLASPSIRSFSSLYGVSCTSVSSCTAVGFYDDSAGRSQAMAERWNGTTWHIQSVPRPVKNTQLLSVSCSRARACIAVGAQFGTGNAQPFAESWNGQKWRVRAMALPHGAPGGVLSAVSCTSPSACTATGTDFYGPHPTLAERWNGRTWRVQRTPYLPSFASSLAEVTLVGVSCTSVRTCAAIGEYNPGGSTAYFIESWNGRRWRMRAAPRPGGFEHGALLGISCVLARCTAVGAYTGMVRIQMTLALGN